MKKSQIAVATAFAVMSSCVSPLASLYVHAEAVQDGCDPLYNEALLNVISGEEIDGIVGRIQDLDLYKAYANAQAVSAKYLTPDEDGDTLAKKINEAKAEADAEISAAEDAVDVAVGKISQSVTSLANLIAGLTGETYVAQGETNAEKYIDLMNYAENNVPLYAEYQELIDFINAGDVANARLKAREINAKLVAENKDPEFARGEAIIDDSIVDVATVKSNLNTHTSTYGVQVTLKALSGKIDAIKAAQKNVETVKAEKHAAIQAYNDAKDEIKDVFDRLKKAGVNVRDIADLNSIVNYANKIKENDDNGKKIIANYDAWVVFINDIEDVHGYTNVTLNDDLSAEIESKLTAILNTTLSEGETNAVVNSIFNPVTDRKVCSANGMVSIEGVLPADKVVIKAELIDDLTDTAFIGLEQDVYDITVEYKGETYDEWQGEYKVTVNVPAEMDGTQATVYYVDDGNRTVQKSVYDDINNTITFTTTHFSHYAIVAPKKSQDPEYIYTSIYDDIYGVAIYGSFKADTEYRLRVTEMAEHFTSEDEDFNAALKEATKVFYRIEVFELTADGQEIKVNLKGQEVVIAIALPEVMDAEKDVYVYFGEENSENLSLVEDVLFDQENKYITFATDQLGDYALVQFSNVENEQPTTPVTPGEPSEDKPIITKPAIEVPNTGIAAKASAGSAEAVSATSGIIVNALALAGAAVAMVVRFVRRRQA